MRTLSRSRPDRTTRGAGRRAPAALITGVSLVVLAGCSGAPSRGWMPEGVTTDRDRITNLWTGSWIAALLVGALVWGLTIWCVVAYRKRKDDDALPQQLRYNLPIEILYTVVPLIMIGVLFYFTQRDERAILDTSKPSDNIVNVVGKRWAWDFNYVTDNVYESSVQVNLVGDETDAAKLPTLYLPVDKTTRFYLTSRDVIHSFWVPAFLTKMDMLPGRVNSFQVTPNQVGTFTGKCAELCGTYHAQMLFQVKVVPQDEYDRRMADLEARGQGGQLPNSLSQEQLVPADRQLIPTPGSTS